jgi:hypothetical protein
MIDRLNEAFAQLAELAADLDVRAPERTFEAVNG